MKRLTTWASLCMLVAVFAACGGGAPPGEAVPSGGDAAGDASSQVEAPVIDPATAGTIQGKVTFTGTAPANEAISMEGEPDCASTYTDTAPPTQETVLVNDDGTVQNVFVYVKDGLGDMQFPAAAEPVVLDQQGCRYHPHVLGVMVGQPLLIRNSDPVLHNIHPRPAENRAFNESQPKQGMEAEKTFSKPEILIPVGCDVHDWMNAFIGVVAHPYFTVTGTDGTFVLPNLPPGEYTIEAVHESFGVQEIDVTVGASETKDIDFSFSG